MSSAITTYANPDLPVYILDSYAVLAYLRGEPAGVRVREVLDQANSGRCRALLPMINLGEVAYIVERRYGLSKTQAILALLNQEPFEIVEADRSAILSAAHIKAGYALSYADAFVVAAAQSLGGVILTGDPEFQIVEELTPVEWLSAD